MAVGTGAAAPPIAVSRDDAIARLDDLACPACGNSSRAEYALGSAARKAARRAGMICYYTERVYHNALGGFRGEVVICDDPERSDAPNSEWRLECLACGHDWKMGDYADLYEVCETLRHEARVARMDKTHRKICLLPPAIRGRDVVDLGTKRGLLRAMADPCPLPSGNFRLAYTLVGDDPAYVTRSTAGVEELCKDMELIAYRPIGPPECVPPDVVAAAEAVTTGVKSRLILKVISLELKEHFSDESVDRFMLDMAGRGVLSWWTLERPGPQAPGRPIDL